MSFGFPPKLADLVVRTEQRDGLTWLIVYNQDETEELSRTSLAEGIMQAEQLFHWTHEAARIYSAT